MATCVSPDRRQVESRSGAGRGATALARTLAAALALACVFGVVRPSAQAQSRFLGRAEITFYGIGLRADPVAQTVPKGFATIVSTFLQAPAQPGALPPFAPDAEVRATLRGPSFATPLDLTAKPNSPFNIPVLTVPGTHTLENIRLVSGGEVLLYATPESVRIEVIDKLLVTSVAVRALSADEIREKGIVFDKSNFQAYNFTAAFAIDDGSKIDIAFPVVLPILKQPADILAAGATLESVDAPLLRSIQTIIPDTLQIQARIPNLSVIGFALALDQSQASQSFFVPPIPGVIVIPGDIGFLNQFFSVMLMVANVAPTGSNLVVSDLTANIVLPPGNDNVVGSADDPLRMAQRATGESPRTVAVAHAGADGRLGTGDDIATLGPGETGNAEFLVEGRREGTHVLEMELSGTLNGLPVGPVPVRGRAAGAVLVRNPAFTLTFTHPEVVNAGEPYTLDVTVTNTSLSPANFVSVNLFEANISGARLDDEPTKSIESIPPGDSKSVTFRLVSNRTGKVTAATLDSDDNVAGRFQLKTAIGELGVPLSPDSLILPKEAASLPAGLRDAALGLLGRAWAVATAPPAALPKDLTRFSKQLVIDRAVETAEAGFRLTLGEPLPRVASGLLFDFLGSEYTDLAARVPSNDTTGLLALLQRDVAGFDLLRRRSVRGDTFADAVAGILATQVAAGAQAFHQALAEQLTSRPGHVSILVSSPDGVPVDGVLVDDSGRRTGGADGSGKIVKELPFSDVLAIKNAGGQTVAQLFIVSVPEAAEYTLRLARRPEAAPDARYDLSLVYPAAAGGLRFASWSRLGPAELPVVQQDGADVPHVRFALVDGPASPAARTTAPAAVNDPPPAVLGAVQIASADMAGSADLGGCPIVPVAIGRVVAVLFSEEVTPASVQDKASADTITAFRPEGNRVLSVALQPGHRIAFVALRQPVGPFVPRTMTVEGVTDRSGQTMAGAPAVPIVTTVDGAGGVVSGRILQADGTPIAGADVRLFYEFDCGEGASTIGVAQAIAGQDGGYQFDYVLNAPGMTVKLLVIDPDTNDLRTVRFRLARSGQHLNVDVVMIGRGTFKGRTLAQDGRTPLPNTSLRITSLTDQSQFGATSDAAGAFEVARVPVGNVLVEAVNLDRPAQIFVSENIPFAGATVSRDLVLLDVNTTAIVIKYGAVTGRVLQADGVTPVAGVPVVAYYRSGSQPGVKCPPPPGRQSEPAECAVAVVSADAAGGFAFASLSAGEIRLNSFDQGSLQEGTTRFTLAASQTFDVSLLLGGGFGTVRGVVLDSSGHFVADAVVGGGLSLTNVNPLDGTFTLSDVPVGRRRIVAASNALQSTGETTIDIVQAGETVHATIVLPPIGAIAGIVRDHDGVPQPGITVWVFQDCYDELLQPSVCIKGSATTDAAGAYRVNKLGVGGYFVSAFRRDLKDGNVAQVAIRYDRQVLITDITFRGAFGQVVGRVLRACGNPPCADTPLAAKVGISGDRLVVAGGKIGARFEYVQNYKIVNNDLTTGAYSFDDVWTGPFTVRAAGQFSPQPVAIAGTMPGPGQTVTADIRLQPTSRITGTMFESDGFTPVTNRQVTLRFHSNAVVVFCTDDAETGLTECQTIPQGIQEAFAATDAAGQFSFPLVNAGPFTITASDAATGKVATLKGSVGAGETVDVSMRLLGRGRVTVRTFRSDGTTLVANATVTLQQIDYPQETRNGLAPGGTIVFEGADALSEGQFVVSAVGPGGFGGRASGRVSVDGENVTVNVYLFDATGTVRGQVVRPDASSALVPVPNAEVLLFNNTGPMAFAVTDAQGLFDVPLVPTGDFTVEAFDPVSAGRGRTTGRMLGSPVPVDVTLRLESLGSLRGTLVQSGSLAPLKGWTVQLNQTTLSGRGLPTQVTQSGVDGSFSFPGASVGHFQLYASRRDVVGTATATGDIARGGQLVDVPMVATIVRRVTGRVTGLVVNAGGSPAPNAQVDVCAASEGCQPTVGGGDGRFSVEGVALGRFYVRATAQVTGNPSVGTSGGTLLFESDVADVTITLLGLSTVEGTVFETINNARVPAANSTVRLFGQPGSGCPGACQQSADADGKFRFINVPAQTFTVVASNLSGQQGSIGDALTPGQVKSGLEVVLAPAVGLQGRVLQANGAPAGGVVAELAVSNGRLFAETTSDGLFAFDAVSAGSYTLSLQDPIAGGLARRRGTVIVAGLIDLGDITLDETPPTVAQSAPASGSLGVPLTPELRVTFTEPVSAATVNATTMTLMGPDGPVVGRVDLVEGDTVGRFRLLPGTQLKDQARYSLRVSGVEDLVGRRMPGDVVSSFTTIDVTPPSILDATPIASATGVSTDTVVRIKYSEIIDPARFAALPVRVTGPQGPIDGRIDYLFSNTVVVFTPLRPLSDDTLYTVDVDAATDLAGLAQASGSHFQFATTDRIPPAVTALTASGNGHVIQGGIARVTATVVPADVAVVDFFLNDAFVFAARTMPFTLSFEAVASLGAPGTQVKVSAVATDTSGNRGLVPAATFVTIDPDQPPAVTITSPAADTAAGAGQRVNVRVRATDDVGVTQMAYSVRGGVVIDAVTRAVSPASADRTEDFGFNVPLDAPPGSSISIQASARDSSGQVTQASVIRVPVLDTVGPVVEITGVSSGQRVLPGAHVTAVVSASDPGNVATIGFAASGVMVFSEQRQVTPAQSPVATSFVFTIPVTATSGDRVLLDAFAIDAAGNRTDAARLILPVADRQPPTASVRTATGGLTMVPGGTVSIVVDGTDDLALANLQLNGTGAFAFAETRSLAEPVGAASATFVVNVPSTVADGATETFMARALDASGNLSVPVTLVLTARTAATVTLPSSLLLAAGETAPLSATLPSPAPAGGVRVDLVSQTPGVATVTPTLVFDPGDTQKTATVTAIAGGSTQIVASINSVPRATTTVTVRGGIVRGTVVTAGPGGFVPVGGALVTVFHAGTPITAVTDPNGAFVVEGVQGTGGYGSARAFSVGATDGTRLGFVDDVLDVPDGSADVTVVLLPVGALSGSVYLPDATTPAAAGVKVDLFESASPYVVIATTFTDAAGAWRFPLVAPGSYFLEASDITGNRARTTATVGGTGVEVTVPITFLGRGSVIVHVTDGAGASVQGARVEFQSSSLFGGTAARTGTTNAEGRLAFDGVFVGLVWATAQDPRTNQGGTASRQLTAHGEVVDLPVQLSSFGNLQGTVFRADGTSRVPNANVTVTAASGYRFSTTTDLNGAYRFDFLPFGSFTIGVADPGTRGLGASSGAFSVTGETLTRDVVLLPQGALLVSVVDADGLPIDGASVTAQMTSGALYDQLSGVTGNVAGTSGRVLLDRLLAGDFVVTATANGLSGKATGLLAGDEVHSVQVQLEARGSITATVFDQDGQTPAAGVVRFTRSTTGANVDVPLTNGVAVASNLRLASYRIDAFDALGRRRAFQNTAVISANGQNVQATLTFVGLGTVKGRVLHPTGGDAGKLYVEVRSLNPDFGGYYSATTDAAGNYEVVGVVVGQVHVSVGKPAEQLLGEASGLLAQFGQTLTLDVLLETNAVALPTSLADANDSTYTIGAGGGLVNGTGFIFGYGATLLSVASNGVTVPFTGGAFGTREDAGREVVVRENGIVGLNVTRKIFVPEKGYFARHLEILTNPTAQPITVDIHLSSRFYAGRDRYGFPNSQFLSNTSSGDATLDVSNPQGADTWAVLQTYGLDPYYDPYSGTPVAFVFSGPNAPKAADVASYAVGSPLLYGWNNVTVPAGGTVTLMHFVSEQASGTGAVASAERLALLPPEALAGMNADEVASVRNFAVPPNGVSAVAPLPELTGSVSGRVLEGDGATPVPGATVTFRSRNPVFARAWNYGTDATGNFSFTGAPRRPVPLDGFELRALHPLGQYNYSPTTISAFGPGQTALVQDVIFSNSGILKGVVKRHTGVPVAGAYVTVPYLGYQFTDAAGRYTFGGMFAGSLTLQGQVSQPQGTPLQIVPQTVQLAPGQVRDDVLLVEPTGGVTGTLRDGDGNLQPGRSVWLHNASNQFRRDTTTDTSGRFALPDVPLGAFIVESNDPVSGFPTKVTAQVAQDQIADVVLNYVGKGTLTVNVTRSTGAPLAGMTVEVSAPGFFTQTAASKADGAAGPFASIPFGQAMTVTAYHPRSPSLLRATKTVTISDQGASTSIALPAFATVTGVIRKPNGTLAGAGVSVHIYGNGLSASATTDVNSQADLGAVPLGLKFTAQVSHPTVTIDYARPVALFGDFVASADGQAIAFDAHYPAVAKVAITVRTEALAPVVGAKVEESDTLYSYFRDRGMTDASGLVEVLQVPEGPLSVRVYKPGSSTDVLELATGQVQAANDGGTVSLVVTPRSFAVTVTGVITQQDGVTPFSRYQVRLLRAIDRQLLATTCPGGQNFYCGSGTGLPTGRFAFPPLTSTGAGFIVQTSSPIGDGQLFEQAVVPAADGAVDVTLALPFRSAVLTGHVYASDGVTPVGGGVLFPLTLSRRSLLGLTVNPDGSYAFASTLYPVEGLLMQLHFPGLPSGVIEVPTVPLTVTDQAVTTDITLPASVYAKIRGTVVAGDGATPLPGSQVDLIFGTGACSSAFGGCSTTTDNDGLFTLAAALPVDGQFTVRAHSPRTSSKTGERTGSAAGQGNTVDLGAITVPISVLKGTATFGPTIPVPYPTVFATLADNSVQFADGNSVDGRFVLYELPAGTFVITAQDPDSGVQGTAQATLATETSVSSVQVQLPEVATVQVWVTGADGGRTENASVALFKSGGFEQIRQPYDTEGGVFQFHGVPVGSYDVQASFNACDADGLNCTMRYAASHVQVDTAGTAQWVFISFDDPGRAAVTVTDPGGNPLASQTVQVTVRSLAAVGPLGTYESTFAATLDGDGGLLLEQLPPGLFSVLVTGPPDGNGDRLSGIATATAAAGSSGAPVSVEVRLDSGVRLLGANLPAGPVWLMGADNYVYAIGDGGAVLGSSHWDGSQIGETGAFTTAAELRVRSTTLCCALAGSFADREFSLAPFAPPSVAGLLVTRRLFVPDQGGFVRYLDTFVNTTGEPVTFNASLWTTFGSSNSPVADVLPTATSGGYLVRSDQSGQAASFGVVFAGVNPPVVPQSLFTDGFASFLPTTTVTIAPGESAALLHFVIQRGPAAAGDVVAQADALATLTDPQALAGLTADDRRMIVNFRVPLPEVATVEVSVTDPDGWLTEDATVALFKPGGGFEQIRLPFDTQNGAFQFVGVPLGAYDVQVRFSACSNCTMRYAASHVQVDAAGTTRSESISLADPGRADVTVIDPGGTALAFQTVEVTVRSLAAVGPLGTYESTFTATLDSNGYLPLEQLPPGLFSVLVTGPPDGNGGKMSGVTTATAIVAPLDPAAVEVRLDSGVVLLGPGLRVGLSGADSYIYPIGDGGAVLGGGYWDDTKFLDAGAFTATAELHVRSTTLCCALAGTLADGEFRLTPFAPPSAAGVVVTRRVLVPAEGGFARYLDTFVNTTGAPVAFAASLWTTPASSNSPVVDVLPSAGTGGYLVRSDPSEQAASFGVVFAGVDPPVVPQLPFPAGLAGFRPTTTITLAPGESAALLHFVVLRGPTASGDVVAKADALAQLTDPLAFAGLTEDDLRIIVNFRIPK